MFGRRHCKEINQKGKYSEDLGTSPSKPGETKENKQLSWVALFSCSWGYLLKYHPLVLN